MRSATWLAALLIFNLGMATAPAQGGLAEDIKGLWQYDGFLFEGNRYPLPNPDLLLTFDFRADGISQLYWKRADEQGFCERLANYQLNDDLLTQETIWINPKNASACSQDPDMRPNLKTVVKISLAQVNDQTEELSMHLTVNGKPFLYILKSLH